LEHATSRQRSNRRSLIGLGRWKWTCGTSSGKRAHDDKERYALRFQDGYAVCVQLVDVQHGSWQVTTQEVLGPGDERIQ